MVVLLPASFLTGIILETLIFAEAVLLATILTTIALLSIPLLAMAAYRDVTTFHIPNLVCAILAAFAVLRLFVIHDFDFACYTLAIGIATFLIGLLLFSRGVVGGGDVKLLTATILLVGYYDVVQFLVGMSLAGGLIALIVFVRHKLSPTPSVPMVPFGAAIASAGIFMMFQQTAIIG